MRDVEKRGGFKVTPELLDYVDRLFGLDEDLRTFGATEHEMTDLDREGVRVVRRERAKYEAWSIQKAAKG
jgi:hypothetical protein